MKLLISVYPKDGMYEARCLNMDIVSVSASADRAVSLLMAGIDATFTAAQKHDAEPYRDAPREYWAEWGLT